MDSHSNKTRNLVAIAIVLLTVVIAINVFKRSSSLTPSDAPMIILGLSFLLILFRLIPSNRKSTKKKREKISPEEKKRLAGITVSLNSYERALFRNRIILGVLIFAVFTTAVSFGAYYDYFRWQGAEQISAKVTKVHHSSSGRKSRRRETTVSLSTTLNGQKIDDTFRTHSRTEYKLGETRPFLILPIETDGVIDYELNGLDEPKKDVTGMIPIFLMVLVICWLIIAFNARPLIAGTTTLDQLPKKYRDIREAIR